jgi:transcriptional regulator with XRE-family HTH domain
MPCAGSSPRCLWTIISNDMQSMLQATRPRYSRERFQTALKGLMEERHLSYRQLAYKTQLSAGYLNHLAKGTRSVPADPVIRTIATALRIEADFFLEYRLRQVADVLDASSQLIDALYSVLLLHTPVCDDMKAMLERPANGDSRSHSLAIGAVDATPGSCGSALGLTRGVPQDGLQYT